MTPERDGDSHGESEREGEGEGEGDSSSSGLLTQDLSGKYGSDKRGPLSGLGDDDSEETMDECFVCSDGGGEAHRVWSIRSCAFLSADGVDAWCHECWTTAAVSGGTKARRYETMYQQFSGASKVPCCSRACLCVIRENTDTVASKGVSTVRRLFAADTRHQ